MTEDEGCEYMAMDITSQMWDGENPQWGSTATEAVAELKKEYLRKGYTPIKNKDIAVYKEIEYNG